MLDHENINESPQSPSLVSERHTPFNTLQAQRQRTKDRIGKLSNRGEAGRQQDAELCCLSKIGEVRRPFVIKVELETCKWFFIRCRKRSRPQW